ncbi:MAG TPA: hypothetical protein VM513_13080 [Kofleriaceae bacterium]|nr:hypothetical protein [Kofleriaceae bacterium]
METLELRLAAMAGCAPPACEREVASWKLDRVGWDSLVVDPYRGAAPYEGYVRAFEAARPALAAQLRAGGAVATRRHYAGEAKNTPGQARARWAVPVQYPSLVAEIAGAPLDAVFDVDRAGRVHAIVGVDEILHRFAARLDSRCAELLDHARDGRCFEIAWVIAEAAMRGERERFDRACALAAGLCVSGEGDADVDRGMRSP